jgi:hypothetical protein
MSGRDFSMSGEIPVPQRRIDNDASYQMRTELLNSVFALTDDAGGPSERTLYNAITGALGIIGAVQPYGGLPRRASEHLNPANCPGFSISSCALSLNSHGGAASANTATP